MSYPVILFFAAIACGTFCTWVVRFFAIKWKIVNKPNPIIPQHTRPVAYLGGAGILAGMTIVMIYIWLFENELFSKMQLPFAPFIPVITGSLGYLAFGIYDDLKPFKPLPKFIGQLVLAMLCVGLGLQASIFDSFVANFLFSVFWILVMLNALNFTDVCDGLVGTICVMTFFTIGVFFSNTGLFYFLVSGATFGFLFFNLPRSSIFLGDGGSHLLGFLLAATGLSGSKNLSSANAIIWLLFISGVPLFELLFITSVRIYKGKAWWKGSPDHFSLRLQKAGLTRLQIDLLAGVTNVIGVSIACLFPFFEIWLKVVSITGIIFMYAIVWKLLLRWDVEK